MNNGIVRMRKRSIPKKIRNDVWVYYMGEKFKGLCYCCNTQEITVFTFHCGHVMSEKNGGQETKENLRPICAQCNLSMNSKNMDTFMSKYGYSVKSKYNYIVYFILFCIGIISIPMLHRDTRNFLYDTFKTILRMCF